MYNFSGIYYQMISDCMLYIIAGIIFLFMSKFWRPSKRNIKEMVVGIVGVILTIVSITYHTYVINQPQILTHEGHFCGENRVNTDILQMEYTFSNEKGPKPIFYLDVFTKKKIYPEDFETKKIYRIFYEAETSVIVRVEVIK